MNKYIIILQRNGEETAAIVSCSSTPRKNNAIIEAIKKAIGQWIETTNEGLLAWNESRENFNIADLALNSYETGSLKQMLNEQGIYDLDIKIDSFTSDFVFDSVLYDGTTKN